MKSEPFYNLLVRVVPPLMSWLLRAWFLTCRKRDHQLSNRQRALARNRPVIAVFWHYSIIYIILHLRREQAAVLVSASRDGEFIARLVQRFNFTAVRGSRHRRGMRALKELQAQLESGLHLAMVADGSKGPPLVAQPGAIYLASRSGSPILPMAWSCSRRLTFKSWDRTVLPLPFSTIDFFYGEPLTVPPKLNSDGIETYRRRLEQELQTLYNKAWSRYAIDEH